jgi:hypothetical protein
MQSRSKLRPGARKEEVPNRIDCVFRFVDLEPSSTFWRKATGGISSWSIEPEAFTASRAASKG